ncbi:ubiquinol-cytochrome C reductase complex subunit oxen [Lycorma delicatula]|uniref:ubiquinol-cytochrome C reductase complex subunit oxen n=1 Tax=Lycorma delicatula TaxID=130591 RepID=UPI003F518490
MSALNNIYNIIFRRSSTYALTIIGASFFFERAFDVGTEHLFEQINKGKMWKHIKHNYTEK